MKDRQAFRIRKAVPANAAEVGELMCALWPHHNLEEMTTDASSILADPDAAVFLAESSGISAGFIQCGLRNDYVEGSSSSPVGYLEGIYVTEALRRLGIGRALVNAAEEWARSRDCTEMGSDCESDNTLSPLFHSGAGYREAGRIICFIKHL